MDTPLISFISAVYNKADVVLETLELLRCQRGVPADKMEFVFVDDSSTDTSLAVLREAAKADSRVKVIASDVNRGPSVRFNDAAAAASGQYLLAVDADDMLPANAARFLLDAATMTSSPLVFGKSRRSDACLDIPADAALTVADSPLTFCAQRKIVRMGFLCERQLWEVAGGADERVFIQDQSLPLRLSHAASRLTYVEDYVYYLRSRGDENLSNNVQQQHHDRFFALLPFLEERGLQPDARRALISQIVSAGWKAKRDSGVSMPLMSWAGLVYVLNRLIGIQPTTDRLANLAADLRLLSGVRRPSEVSN
ncbi:glycosyltransferase family 2 protein [Agrobacterium sp. ES01]|uniref:glycosyltransferase family 2 protein n=1 Tax=Agrobacterium sp. ES01 TaxID=3420714 RepID=UPI003D1469D4